MITTLLSGRVVFWITLFIVLSHMNEGVCMRNVQELVLSYRLVAPRVPHVVRLGAKSFTGWAIALAHSSIPKQAYMEDLQNISKMTLQEVRGRVRLSHPDSSIQQNWLSSSPQVFLRQLRGDEFSVTGHHTLQCLNSDEGACSKTVTTD